MKRKISVLLILMALFMSDCGNNLNGNGTLGSIDAYEQAEKHTYYLSPYNVSITLPDNWKLKEDTAYNLKCTDGNGYISAYAGADIDTPKGWDAYDEYEYQCDYIFSGYDELVIVEDAVTEVYEDKTILTKLWSAERDGNKNYYYCCLVDFIPEDQGFVWIAFNGVPSYISAMKGTFDEILKTVKYDQPSADSGADKAISDYLEQYPSELTQTFELPDCNMRISIPESWEQQEDTEWDLQCGVGLFNLGMNAYEDGNLPDGWEPYDAYELIRDEVLSTRKNAALVENTSIMSYDDKAILTEMWSAEFNDTKFYYYFCLIDFLPDNQGYAWVMFSGIPTYTLVWRDTLDMILASAEYGKNATVEETAGTFSEGLGKNQAELTQTFQLPYCDMHISLPGDWVKQEDTDWDLQCLNGTTFFNMFAYADTELPDGYEPYDIFDSKCHEIFSARDNVVLISNTTATVDYDDKTVLTSLWSAERDGTEFYYYCCLIDFLPEDQGFAYVVFNGPPSCIFGKTYIFDEILASAKYGDASN